MTKDEGKLEFMRQQFKRHELYALYWHAMAMTGQATKRDIARGRKPTAEEEAQGIVLPMEQLTDDEKIKDALGKMLRHIHIMNELNDEMGGILLK